MNGLDRLLGLLLFLVIATSCGGPSGPPATSTPSNTLEWTAETERGVYGYLIYRSENRDGPFTRINTTIVRVPDDREQRHAYTWVDSDVEPGTLYYYYLDAVSMQGVKQRFTGVLSRETPRKGNG